METAPQILIVEDDTQIRRFVRMALEADRYRVFEAETMARGVIEAGTRKPDLLIVDLGLPDGNGVDLIRDVRAWSTVPILVLSARIEESEKVDALDAGADDYLTKPFGTGELSARVRAMLRRRARASASPDAVHVFGDVTVDLGARTVARAGEVLHVSASEYHALFPLR